MGRDGLSPLQRKIMVVLRAHGPIDSTSGRCTPLLIERLPAGSYNTNSVSTACKQLEDAGLIVRRVNGKRTSRIALPQHGDEPMRPFSPEVTPAAPDEESCKFCARRGEPCAMHRRFEEQPQLPPEALEEEPPEPGPPVFDEPGEDAPARRERKQRAVVTSIDRGRPAPTPTHPTARPSPPPASIPRELVEAEVARALGSILMRAAEDREEIADLRGQVASLVDELARTRQKLIEAHEKIGSLSRSNELLGNRLAAMRPSA